VLDPESPLCLRCLDALPVTHFQKFSNNPVEKLFWGRLPIVAATAQYYFTRHTLMQHLMHHIKYRGHKALGFYLGQQLGNSVRQTQRFTTVDALVPLPLFAARERARGYNQAAVLCDGMADILQKPVLKNSTVRTTHTESQTTKSRIERWQNMKDHFEVTDVQQLTGKHLLLVDDVVTTGATLEACGRALLGVDGVQLSVATLCVVMD